MSQRSEVFQLLNGDGDDFDVDGLVAYALYKHHKREWCAKFEQDNGRTPTDQDKLEFARSASTEGQLARYLKDAQDALGEFAGSLIDEERPEIAEEAVKGRVELAAKRIEAQGSWHKMILSGVVSTLISTSALIILAIGIRLFGIDLLDAVTSIGELSESTTNSKID